MEVYLRYGNAFQKVDLPSSSRVYIAKGFISKRQVNLEETLSNSLDEPVGTDSLEKMVSPGSRVALIVDDTTRPTPIKSLLPLVIARLLKRGLSKDDISIIMATGAHKRPTWDEVGAKIGRLVLDSGIRVYVHDPLDKKELKLIGFTSRGTPIWINSKALDADVKIGIGLIKPHPWAGFTGGAKIILPGISAWEAIGKNHFLAVSEEARIGNIEGNPVRGDMEEAAQKTELDMIINTILDDRGRPIDCVVGDPIEAHRKGVEVVRTLFETSIDEEVDVAIWAFGPGDNDLWDVIGRKFIGAHKKILKDGGTLILVAECSNGIYKYNEYGLRHVDYSGRVADYSRVIEMLRSGASPDEIISETLRGNMPYMEVGVKAYIISTLIRRSNIIIVSHNLRKEDVKWLGSLARTATEAVSQAIQLEGEDARIAVVPEAYASDGYIFRRA